MKEPATRTYVFSSVALLALLGLTIAAAGLSLGPFNTAAAMLISLTKALIIILFFMHMRYSRRILWIFAAAGFFWLGLLLALALIDYLTRGWH